MPRRLKLIPKELGELQLYLIYDYDGVWEEHWRPLQGHPFTDVFTRISKEVMDHALKGWTKPLVDALGLPPAGALRRLPDASKQCARRAHCTLYIPRHCVPTSDLMPWCYEPDGIAKESDRHLAAEAISLWREGVYILVVQETK